MTWEIFFSDDPDPVARQQNVQRCIQSLVHACQCSDANCLPSCQRMKRVLTHAKTCKRQADCHICKHLLGLCNYHVKHCQEAECSVIYCSSIKQKQQQQQQQKQQQQEKQELRELQLCRRMAAIKRCNAAAAKKRPRPPPANPAQNAPHLILIQQQRPVVPSQQQPAAPLVPQRKALHQLEAALRSPAIHSRHQQILQILKSDPALLVAFIQHTAQDAQYQEQAGGDLSAGNVGLENVGVDDAYVVLGGVGNVNRGVGRRPRGARVVNVGLGGGQPRLQ